MREIDLSELTKGGEVRNLSGHERGYAARQHFGLDGADNEAEPVRIRIPSGIYLLTPSFFQGMFSQSVRALGSSRERFLEHYRFDAPSVIMRQIDQGIERVQTRRGDLLAG